MDECSWMIEAPGLIHVELAKFEDGGRGGSGGGGGGGGGQGTEQGEEVWWPCVLRGDPEVPVTAALPTGDLNDMSDAQRAHVAEAMTKETRRRAQATANGMSVTSIDSEQTVGAGEGGDFSISQEDGQRQMLEEMRRRKESEQRALNDPKKREMLMAMREKFPDVPIEFR